MSKKGDSRPSATISTANAAHVGSTELRANLAKYLKLAKAGRPVIVRERGKDAYVLLRYGDETTATVFGCLRDRTDYVRSSVVNAKETWPSGELP